MFRLISFCCYQLLALCVGLLLSKITKQFFSPRSGHKLLSLLMVFMLSVAASITIFPDETDGMAGVLLCFSLVVFLFCRGRFLLKLSVVLLLYPILISIAFLTEDFGFIIWYHVFEKNTGVVGESILHVFSSILRIPAWYLVYRCTRHWISNVSEILTPRMWIVIDMISLASFLGIITVIKNTDTLTSYLAYPVCIAAIFTSLSCCYLCTYIVKSLKADMELETLKYQQAYYLELEESRQNTRRLRHDMKNHLHIIATLFHGGKITEAKKYLEGLTGEFTDSPYVFCNNSTINAILCAKYELTQQHEIDCSFEVDLKEPFPLDVISLCSLFANTLDNALEANLKIAAVSHRKISLKARCHNGCLSYELSNTKVNSIQEKHDRILSDKENPSNHGIGLANVKSIVAGVNGTLAISHTDTEFTVTMLLSS